MNQEPSGRQRRRGSAATYFALTLMVIGGFAALAIELTYVHVVRDQLRGVADSAGHAALMQLDGTHDGMEAAREAAHRVTLGLLVNGRAFELEQDDLEFGYLDVDDTWVPSDDPRTGRYVRVRISETVGLGFGQMFFGRDMTVTACGAIMAGDGNATTGEEGGPGLENGHFDWDTTTAAEECPGAERCSWTDRHTHEYDDNYDVTAVNLLDMFGNHTPPEEVIGAGTPFKIRVVNADLSPGAWLTVNGVDTDVTAWDEQRHSDLENYNFNGSDGHRRLTDLWLNFDVRSIANCELHPTNTPDVRRNRPGPYGEWRSGALTVQLVRPNASPTPGTSAGGHDAVISEDDGLLWEGKAFWHWDGPSYTERGYDDWQDLFDSLECSNFFFMDQYNEGVCP